MKTNYLCIYYCYNKTESCRPLVVLNDFAETNGVVILFINVYLNTDDWDVCYYLMINK